MTIRLDAHYRAMKDLIEIMAIASLIALLADCIWIIRDIYADGMTCGRFIVMILLDFALTLQTYALYKFHKQLMADILTAIKVEKRKICKLRAKHKKN